MLGQQVTAIATNTPAAGRLNLHPQKVRPMLNSHIVSSTVSPGLAHRKTSPRSLRHKSQLHPLPAFFIARKFLPRFHLLLQSFKYAREVLATLRSAAVPAAVWKASSPAAPGAPHTRTLATRSRLFVANMTPRRTTQAGPGKRKG